MSHLVARVLVDTPATDWLDAVLPHWNALRGAANLSWSAEIRRRGATAFDSVTLSSTAWAGFVDDLRSGRLREVSLHGKRGGTVVTALAAELTAVITVKPPANALLDRLYPSLPSVVESDRHVRAVSASVSATEAGASSVLERLLSDAFSAASACWAQLALEPRCAGPFSPAGRSWREWEPHVRHRAPEAAWRVILGRRHVEALGGFDAARDALAAFRPAVVATRGARSGLAVETAPSPVGADDARVAALRDVLRPILLESPLMPAPAFLVGSEEVDATPPAIEGAAVRRLADRTYIIDTGTPYRRDDVDAGHRLVAVLGRVHDYLASLGLPRRTDRGRRTVGEVLCLPRFLGNTVYARHAPSLPALDTGEPVGERLPFTVVVDGRARGALLQRLVDVVQAQALGATCELADDRLVCSLDAAWARGERLLTLLLAIDREAAAARGAAALGVVLGRIVPVDEMLERIGRGEWPGIGPQPD